MRSSRAILPNTAPHTAIATLKTLGRRHSKKLALTLLRVVVENATCLLYPLLAGFAISAIITRHALQAMLYAVMAFTIWETVRQGVAWKPEFLHGAMQSWRRR